MRFFYNKIIMDFSVVKLTIPSGSSSVSERLFLEENPVTHCALFKNGEPTKSVSLKISTIQGDDIHPLVPHQEFEKTGGSHIESRKEINIPGAREIKLTAIADENLTEDFTVTMLFYHEPTN